ncbi:S-methyl thiohydantoin desulfurase domain-containing protein [Lactiplantibacillus plantarum]|uniref:S-methyl thiohydantoin desulfurase domain-containing protein n=1 Tax=Lactiplantibacillus plantarum TaxID=1590 RepID=UPI003879756D
MKAKSLIFCAPLKWFNVGDIHIAVSTTSKSELVVTIQNENYLLHVMVSLHHGPDLIIILDAETLTPITTE